MKKPILATAGVVGACAACCAIPIFIPLASGLSVAGLLAFDWEVFCSQEFIAAATGTIVAVSVGFMMWRARRRSASSACAAPDVSAPLQSKSSCGCAGTSKPIATGGSL